MKFSRFVCLLTAASSIFATPRVTGQTPALRPGISVELAVTSNAVAFPDADNADAWIIAVTAEGRLYFGVKPVTPEQLREEMKVTPRRRDARLYIKADARAPFAAVKHALLAAHEAFFETAVLLTQQSQNLSSAPFILPHGLEVSLALPSATVTLLQLRGSGSLSPEVKVNDQELPWSGLKSAMAQAPAGQSSKIVVIEAAENLPAAQLISAIDLSRSIGAHVVISLIGLYASA
jgi:biopolymer transport protein ExbD